MLRYRDLLTTMATTFQNIPEVVALMDKGTASIIPYLDLNPDRNNSSKAVYQMSSGSLLLVWMATALDVATTQMPGWVHIIQVYIKARRGESALDLMNALVDGVPQPGTGRCWRRDQLLTGALPTDVRELVRLTDEEGIDYYVVTTATQEEGDTP